MFHCKRATMKSPHYKAAMSINMGKSSAAVATADTKLLHLKASPVKLEHPPSKPHCPPTVVTAVLFPDNNAKAVHDKENSASRDHDRTVDERFEDSGYLSLHNSQIYDHPGDDEDDHFQGKLSSYALPPSTAAATRQEKIISPKSSPSKCQEMSDSPSSLVPASPTVGRHRTGKYSLSSTPSNHLKHLTILNFQQAVCEELSKSYQKNKRYDWSIFKKVAEDHLLDRVIGGQMGLEYVDVFSSLLSRNMRRILTDILALLGDMDLISCKKVSSTWRRLICEDTAALHRCQRAEQALRESSYSVGQRGCSLTRDVAVSRVVLSCMQTVASPSTFSASSASSHTSTTNCRVSRRTAASQKSGTAISKSTRFDEYLKAASSLQQHESLRSCRHCGSPATHSPEMQRATCTRSSCQFDFCTYCQEAFHGSTPCRVVQPRSRLPSSKSAPLIPGSARSKRSIRRL